MAYILVEIVVEITVGALCRLVLLCLESLAPENFSEKSTLCAQVHVRVQLSLQAGICVLKHELRCNWTWVSEVLPLYLKCTFHGLLDTNIPSDSDHSSPQGRIFRQPLHSLSSQGSMVGIGNVYVQCTPDYRVIYIALLTVKWPVQYTFVPRYPGQYQIGHRPWPGEPATRQTVISTQP